MNQGRRFAVALSLEAIVIAALFLTVTQAHADTVRREYLRVTYYVLPGRMADGAMVHEGAAACSMWMPFGTVLEFDDGRQVVCHDRGHGDWFWRGWTDVWAPSAAWGRENITRAYGDYAWVSVARWGWGE